MDTLNIDLYRYIFDILPISDKRSFICICKIINILSIYMADVEKKFQLMINDTIFITNKYYGFYNPLYKYTIELLFDNHPIPDKYIITKNKVLYAYPKVYKTLVKRGNLPLIKKLLKINDLCFAVKNIYLINRIAAKTGNICILEWMIKKKYESREPLTAYAAEGGQLETLKWLEKQNYNVGDFAAAHAAGNVHMDVLNYLINDKQIHIISGRYAASKGHFDMVKYLYSLDHRSVYGVSNAAAKSGHLNILKFAYEGGETVTRDFVCGHLHVLEWLIDNKHIRPNATISQMVALTGNLECLQLLYANGYPIFTEVVFAEAIRSGNIDMIKWLRDNKCPYNKSISGYNSRNKLIKMITTRLPILKLLIELECFFDDSLCNYAAYYGNLEVLNYLYMSGFKLNKKVIEYAATQGHLHIIIWAREHGCEWDSEACLATVHNNQLDVLRWLRGFDRKTCGIPSNETEICPWDKKLYRIASDENHNVILEFALENGCNDQI